MKNAVIIFLSIVSITAMVFLAVKLQEDAPEPVETTPPSCIQALDLADYIIDRNGDALDHSAEGFTHYLNDDATGITRSTEGIEEVHADLEAAYPEYIQSKEACK